MARKIEKLTADQETELVRFREAMWRQGTSTLSAERETAEAAIVDAYGVIGRPAPRFFWMPSPMTCALGLYAIGKVAEDVNLRARLGAGLWAGLWAGLRDGLRDGLWDWLEAGLEAGLRDGLRDGLEAGLRGGLRDGLWDGLRDGLRDAKIPPSTGHTYWWGQMDTYWLAYYRFCSMIGVIQKGDLLKRLDIMERIASSCGFWYPRDGICIISDRFAGVSWDEARNQQGMPIRLHSATGPAVSFRDGWGLHYWHGLRIPARLIEQRDQITPDTIEAEDNAELRRVALEIYGFERYLSVREARVIAADELHGQPRRLLEVMVHGEAVRIIEVHNGSLEPDGSHRRFHLGAGAGGTPHDVVAASYGLKPQRYLEAVRT